MRSSSPTKINPLPLSPLLLNDKKWVQQYVTDRWLNLGDTTKIVTANPFLHRTQTEIESPHVYLLDFMRKPENFGFTCKWLFNKQLAPFQLAILRELWVRPFPMLLGSRGMGKSWLLAVYAILRGLFQQGSKIVIVGAAFRQAKVVFDYCQDLWDHSPVLRDLVGSDKKNGPRRDVDMCRLRLGESLIYAVPLGDGSKIRGLRANIILADEFASIPLDIFERVVRGFGAVSLSPVEKLQHESRKQALKELKLWDEKYDSLEDGRLSSNQTIVSGTAYYAFNHFYSYWRRYKAIIESRGDQRKLEEIFGGKVPTDLDYRDYCVIRIPAELLPVGFMDKKQVAQARATVHIGTFQMEYGAVFATDSNGFFKRAMIEGCVVGNPGKPICHACGEVCFDPILRGDPRKEYVMAIDPASEQDNFSIVILELWPDHRRIVHCWTTTRARFKAKLAKNLTEDGEFYGYAASKIRDLMKLFPTIRIAIDSQGGGVAVMEALQDKTRLKPGERPLYPVIVPDEPKDTDGLAGNHILEVIQFAKSDWVSKANHGMKKDFEDKWLLFPNFNPAILGLAYEEDKQAGRVIVDTDDRMIEKLYDTLEDCVMEIEELKDELATIVHTQTGTSMRDRWDTPETKTEGNKRGRLRKDRYSALLMANAICRDYQANPKGQGYNAIGGFAKDIVRPDRVKLGGAMWIGPAWWTEGANVVSNYGGLVRRQR